MTSYRVCGFIGPGVHVRGNRETFSSILSQRRGKDHRACSRSHSPRAVRAGEQRPFASASSLRDGTRRSAYTLGTCTPAGPSRESCRWVTLPTLCRTRSEDRVRKTCGRIYHCQRIVSDAFVENRAKPKRTYKVAESVRNRFRTWRSHQERSVGKVSGEPGISATTTYQQGVVFGDQVVVFGDQRCILCFEFGVLQEQLSVLMGDFVELVAN